MSDYLVTGSELTGIADAIRSKGGTSAGLVFPDGFVSAVGALPVHFWEGDDMELVQDLGNIDWTFNDTNWSSWTPGTTQGTIKAREAYTTFQADMVNYDYLVQWMIKIELAYTASAEQKAMLLSCYGIDNSYMSRLPGSYTDLMNKNYNSAVAYNEVFRYLGKYYNTGGEVSRAYTSGYGVFPGSTTISANVASSNTPTITVNTPIIYARCHDTYFKTANANAVDAAN